MSSNIEKGYFVIGYRDVHGQHLSIHLESWATAAARQEAIQDISEYLGTEGCGVNMQVDIVGSSGEGKS